MQIITLATTPNNSRVQIFNSKITLFLFWVSAGDQPIVLLNPNITQFATELKNGQITDVGEFEFNGSMRAVQFRNTDPIEVSVDETKLRLTLQKQTILGPQNIEIELLVEEM
jgi:hypothetical protein